MVSAANEGGRQGPSLRPLHQGLPSQVRGVHVDPGRWETDLCEAGQWSDDQDEGREGPSGEFNVNLFVSAIFLLSGGHGQPIRCTAHSILPGEVQVPYKCGGRVEAPCSKIYL